MHAGAAVVWDSGTNGPLSSSGATPTPVTLSLGTNSVISSVGSAIGTQNWITVHLPDGLQLSQYVLASYTSTDGQGFTGFGSGTTFTASTISADSYLGYSHFGTTATNNGVPPANLVGSDLLPLMANNAPTGTSPGAQGFTIPLAAGDYTFLIQQLGAATSYQFDFNVTAAPEPSGIVLAVGAGVLGLSRRRSACLRHCR
jgi:hypothetical protein